MKNLKKPDRVEIRNVVWRGGRHPVQSIELSCCTWLEVWPIPKRAFAVTVHVYSEDQLVLKKEFSIPELGRHKSMLASPLGVVLE